MKHTIMGFQQEKLMELGLDLVHAAILRYFIDFKNTDAMKSEIIDGKVYYWVNYEKVIEELPMLGLKKQSVRKRLYNLRDAKVLTHYTKKAGGTYSFFGIGDKYLELITSTKTEKKEEKPQEGGYPDTQGVGIKIPNGGYENTNPVVPKYPTNNPSTKYPFNNNVEKENLDENIKKIIEYLNLKTKKNFKANTQATVKLIKARLNEGFTLEDFKSVIDNKVLDWTGTQWEKYLVPTTLFAGKFESYLNEKHKEQVKSEGKESKPKQEVEVIWGGF